MQIVTIARSSLRSLFGLKSIQKFAFHKATPLQDIFTVQDEADYNAKVKESKTPVIVDFYATWCGPCRILTPRLETIIGGKGDKVNLAKVDIDELQDLAIELRVSSVPTVFAVKNGKITDQFIGVLDDDKVESFVDKLIGSK